MPAFKQAKYTKERSAEIRLTALGVLQDAGKPLTISEICAADLSLTYQTTQKMARELSSLVEAGLVEAIGNGTNRSYILSAKVYKQNNESAKYVRQTDIDAVRYPELIIKLAKQQDGVITKEDVAELLKITKVQAYLQIKKLLAEGKLVPNQKGKYANYKLKD